MEMVWQEHNRRNLKRSILSSFKNRRSKKFTPSLGGKDRPTLMSDNDEEERSTFFRSPIVTHAQPPLVVTSS
tara:strand:+ start:25659 stop:25874 length:216 start_codon:yes stop_codon:yes gene_type:complete